MPELSQKENAEVAKQFLFIDPTLKICAVSDPRYRVSKSHEIRLYQISDLLSDYQSRSKESKLLQISVPEWVNQY